jgi:hypothetical protein
MSKARELAELSRTVSDSADATAITINSSEEVTFADDIFLADGKKAVFGAGSDLQIYHDASDSIILDNGTGNLKIQANDLVLKNADGSKEYLKGTDGGSVRVRYNNTTVLETTATGIDVTGTVTASDMTLSDSTNPTLTITDTTTPTSLVLTAGNLSTTIGTTTDHRLKLETNGTERLRIENNGDISFYDSAGSSQALFWDASAESLGIGITPNVALEVDGGTANGSIARFHNENARYLEISAESDGTYDDAIAVFKKNTSVGQYAFRNSTTEYMRINDTGVGIGITPSKKLTVFGTGAGNATVQIEGEGGADPYINFLANNTQHWSLGVDDSDADKFKLSEHSALGTNDYLVVDVTGNVGIGNDDPAFTLDVGPVGASGGDGIQISAVRNATLRFLGTDASIQADEITGRLEWYTSDTNNAGVHAQILTRATNTAGSGELQIWSGTAGGLAKNVIFRGDQAVFNEDSANMDFRVESDDNANQFVLDAGANKITVGTNTGINSQFLVQPENHTYATVIKSDNAITNGTALAYWAQTTQAYSTTSSGTQLRIPITSQGNLWQQYYVEIRVVTGEYNKSFSPQGGKAEFEFTSLTSLSAFTSLSTTGNISSVTVDSGNMEIVINFTTGYTSGLNNYEGVLLHASVLSRDPNYIQWKNGTLN